MASKELREFVRRGAEHFKKGISPDHQPNFDAFLDADVEALNFLDCDDFESIHNQYYLQAAKPIAEVAKASALVLLPYYGYSFAKSGIFPEIVDYSLRYNTKSQAFMNHLQALLPQEEWQWSATPVREFGRAETFSVTQKANRRRREQWLRWTKSRSYNQTLTTYLHSETSKPSTHPGKQLRHSGQGDWYRSLLQFDTKVPRPEADDGILAIDPFRTTALDELPDKWTNCLFGRFLLGAHYVLLPVEVLFHREILRRTELKKFDNVNALDFLCDLYSQVFPALGGEHIKEIIGDWSEELGAALVCIEDDETDDGGRSSAHNELRNFIQYALLTEEHRKAVDYLVGRLVDPILDSSFYYRRPTVEGSRPKREAIQYAGFRCAGNNAYVYSDLSARLPARHDDNEPHFTRTIILDIGLNRYQRGRLVQNLIDFATNRVIALRYLHEFRVAAKLISKCHSELAQIQSMRSAEILESKVTSKAETEDSLEQEFQNLRASYGSIRALGSSLAGINQFFEGGLTYQASATQNKVELVRSKVRAIDEQRIAGFSTLTDHLERRFIDAARLIGRVGERYKTLRARLVEMARVVETGIEISERQALVRSSRVLEGLTLVAGTYYGTTLMADFIEHSALLGWYEKIADRHHYLPNYKLVLAVLVAWSLAAVVYRRKFRLPKLATKWLG